MATGGPVRRVAKYLSRRLDAFAHEPEEDGWVDVSGPGAAKRTAVPRRFPHREALETLITAVSGPSGPRDVVRTMNPVGTFTGTTADELVTAPVDPHRRHFSLVFDEAGLHVVVTPEGVTVQAAPDDRGTFRADDANRLGLAMWAVMENTVPLSKKERRDQKLALVTGLSLHELDERHWTEIVGNRAASQGRRWGAVAGLVTGALLIWLERLLLPSTNGS